MPSGPNKEESAEQNGFCKLEEIPAQQQADIPGGSICGSVLRRGLAVAVQVDAGELCVEEHDVLVVVDKEHSIVCYGSSEIKTVVSRTAAGITLTKGGEKLCCRGYAVLIQRGEELMLDEAESMGIEAGETVLTLDGSTLNVCEGPASLQRVADHIVLTCGGYKEVSGSLCCSSCQSQHNTLG